MNKTYIDRANANQRVFEKANEAIRMAGAQTNPGKKVLPYSKVYTASKLGWFQEIVNMEDDSPLKTTTYNPDTLGTWNYGKQRHGGPKRQWFDEGKVKYWESIKHHLPSPYRTQTWQDSPRRKSQLENAAGRRLLNPRRLFD